MNWETPSYEEIRMDAEIGSYQADEGEPFTPTSGDAFEAPHED